jgi:hypothetical protein
LGVQGELQVLVRPSFRRQRAACPIAPLLNRDVGLVAEVEPPAQRLATQPIGHRADPILQVR